MDEFDKSVRKLLANITDRVTILILTANTSLILEMEILQTITMFLFLDFMIYVILRTFLQRTPGDIMFGIVIKTGFPKILRLSLRWLLGYLSPFSGFLLHVPAIRWKSFCDSIVGINSEKV
ncbi:MAG: hypothetical protein NZ927_08030 [Candidatus Calescibacterium sp.]|nr:hypothetical protein [Candidatus Calescibacterium sp.]MDW8087719.1 hypothetical protein [Candidatus Calescibacterium sp.]